MGVQKSSEPKVQTERRNILLSFYSNHLFQSLLEVIKLPGNYYPLPQLEEQALSLFNMGRFDLLKSLLGHQVNQDVSRLSPTILFIYIHLMIFEEKYRDAMELLAIVKRAQQSKGNVRITSQEVIFFEVLLSYLGGNRDASTVMIQLNRSELNTNNRNWVKPGFNLGHGSLLQSPIGYSGDLSKAKRLYSKILLKLGIGRVSMSSLSYCPIVLSEVFYEMAQIDKADVIVKAIPKVLEVNDPGLTIPVEILRSKIHTAQGKGEEGQKCLARLSETLDETSLWYNIVISQKVRSHIKNKEYKEVEEWVDNHSLKYRNKAMTEFNCSIYLTLAKALLLLEKYKEARVILSELKTANHRMGIGSRIELCNLEAVYFHKIGEMQQSQRSLKESLSLGEKFGYYQTYIDMGEIIVPVFEYFQNQMDDRSKRGNFLQEIMGKLMKNNYKVSL